MKRFHVIVTAGPTREYLDPVRFLSNPSTGKMGFAIASAARDAGHRVTLISGPVAIKAPKGVAIRDIISARDMLREVEVAIHESREKNEETIFIATAAVADWRPARCAREKLKKDKMNGILKLVRNPDILKTVARKKISNLHCIGFAAETNDVIANAKKKCKEKKLEMIVANDVSQKDAGFGVDTNRVIFLYRDGIRERLPLMSKRAVAKRLIQKLQVLL